MAECNHCLILHLAEFLHHLETLVTKFDRRHFVFQTEFHCRLSFLVIEFGRRFIPVQRESYELLVLFLG